VALPAKAEPATPAPFTASYAVAYRGLNAGLLHFELRSEEPGIFIYETRAEPSLLARFLVGGAAVERSIMRIDANGVRPLSWFVEDGKAGKKQDGDLVFAWDEGKVSGTVKGQPVELRTVPGLQERLSIQIAVMTFLLRADEPGTIPMISDDEVKRYSYTRAGSGLIRTKMGEFATVLYESTRPGSSRVSRFWHAPTLGYIPVRAEQIRDGKVETVMELVEVLLEARR
jgi:hypothetical protein